MTDRQQLERLMAIVEQAREAQREYYATKKTSAPDQMKNKLSDMRMKWDAVDNLFRALRQLGYVPTKHSETEQSKMF
jgi:hypothetical protein